MSLEVFLIKEGKKELVNNLTGVDLELEGEGANLNLTGFLSREPRGEVVSLQKDFFKKVNLDLLVKDSISGLAWELPACEVTQISFTAWELPGATSYRLVLFSKSI